MTSIVYNLSTSTKTKWNKGERNYLIYGVQNLDNINVMKFARISNEKVYLEGEQDIEEIGIREAKHVIVIIDTKNQIILIERKKSVFQDAFTPTKILQEFFKEKVNQGDYAINIYPLVTQKAFWNYIDAAEGIFELTLELNAPNMALFGNTKTRKLLSKIKNEMNNEKMEITFKNSDGKLKILKSSVGDYVDYLREVGGKYILKYLRNGVVETKSSEVDIASTEITINKSGKFTEDEIVKIKEKLNLLHELKSRDEK